MWLQEAMMGEQQVGVRELKARLSKYLREVKKGRTVLITEHGKPVGRLMPAAATLEARLQAMVDAGLAEWDGKKLPPARPVARVREGFSVADLLIEDRR
jgi:prevent-host-death family protein